MGMLKSRSDEDRRERLHLRRRSLHPQSSTQPRASRLHTLAVYAALIGAEIVVAGDAFGAVTSVDFPSQVIAARYSPFPGTPSNGCHLSFDDKMELRQGRWGLGVHPVDPAYFCYQRQKRLEERGRSDR
jgi:hypothetical protein